VICIDGPAASGKTTVARALADRLSVFYLDTGVLYRALTWVALERSISPSDGDALAQLARDLKIEVKPAPPGDFRQTLVTANGQDVSLAIRTQAVDAHVSEVSAHRAVREALVDVQRAVAERGGVVLAGRDMGTVIWPQAEVKLYLDATDEERARRRQKQAEEQGVRLDFQAVLADLRRRDQYDSSREVAPLRPASDAIVLDTTPLTAQQVVEKSLELVRSRTSTSAGESGSF
jgi:cytidylate kinase